MSKRLRIMGGSTRRLHSVMAAMVILSCVSGRAATTYRVWTGGSSTPPYSTWATAASDIQTAVNAASSGDTVLVTNGTYNVTAQLEITNGVVVRSVNGPEVTTIDAGYVAGRRVVEMAAASALLSGFHVTRGRLSANAEATGYGAGILLSAGTVSNCVVQDNQVTYYGGGIYMTGGTVVDCAVTNNRATDSLYSGGGGIYANGGLVNRCMIADNSAVGRRSNVRVGGGIRIDGGTLVKNCLIRGNRVTGSGLGAGEGGGVALVNGQLLNSTVVENFATEKGGGVFQGGGAISNCIVYFNSVESGLDDVYDNLYRTAGVTTHSCSEQAVAGTGNMADDPETETPPPTPFSRPATTASSSPRLA